jgi:DNA-binding response OmpR family regulator
MRHILVVESDSAVCAAMQMGLEADGARRVTCAPTAEEALGVIARDRPDAAIVAGFLPKLSGIAVASRALCSGIPVLLICGHLETVVKLERAGCRYLLKPVRIEALLAETRALLDDARQRQAELTLQLRKLTDNGFTLLGADLATDRASEASRERSRH